MPGTRFYSNGKFLVTGEYLVMHGAVALALPLRYGQEMYVNQTDSGFLEWTSYDINELWFKGEYELPSLSLIETNDRKKALLLQKILRTADQQSGGSLRKNSGLVIRTRANFDRRWGLGTSSTLINNIADWLGTDPFRLLWEHYDASGYDVACAKENSPLLYSLSGGKPIIEKVQFHPSFSDKIWFVYSGRKQDTREGVKRFRSGGEVPENMVLNVSDITREIISTANLKEFMGKIEEHELLIAGLLQTERAKEKFSDFNGAIKSLGAWGGDFFMAVTEEEEEYVRGYFGKRGLDNLLSFDEITLHHGIKSFKF